MESARSSGQEGLELVANICLLAGMPKLLASVTGLYTQHQVIEAVLVPLGIMCWIFAKLVGSVDAANASLAEQAKAQREWLGKRTEAPPAQSAAHTPAPAQPAAQAQAATVASLTPPTSRTPKTLDEINRERRAAGQGPLPPAMAAMLRSLDERSRRLGR